MVKGKFLTNAGQLKELIGEHCWAKAVSLGAYKETLTAEEEVTSEPLSVAFAVSE